jgi:hypothetical protein
MSPSTIALTRKAAAKARCVSIKRAREAKNDFPIEISDSEESISQEKVSFDFVPTSESYFDEKEKDLKTTALSVFNFLDL